MVNITYGALYAPDGFANSSRLISPQGTDMIVTYGDGQIVAYSPGDIAWILTCTTLVWLMVPGLGYLYSGLARRKNSLHMLLITIVSLSIISLQWFLGGYSLTFAQKSSSFWGTLKHFGFMHVLQEPEPASNNQLPQIVFAVYELMFACLVPAIALGAACDRARLWPFFVLIFCWTTLVYDPIAMWIFNPNGWASANKWGVLDYAGGGPVELASGCSGAVISIYLGKRYGYGTEKLMIRPHNVSHVVWGTVLVWVGWLGFSGGSTFAANLRAAMAMAATNLSASVGGITWMVMDYRAARKWSVVSYCTGAISGLVAITPAAGFVGMPVALLIGIVSAFGCNLCTGLKYLVGVDDAMDLFAVHALGGTIGLILTGIFAQKSVAHNDGYLDVKGGWLDGHFVQLPLQLAWIAVCACWSAVVTLILMFVLDHCPFIGPFRVNEISELVGLDTAQCGEMAYDWDDDESLYDLEHHCSHHHRHHHHSHMDFDSSLPPVSEERAYVEKATAIESSGDAGPSSQVQQKLPNLSVHSYHPEADATAQPPGNEPSATRAGAAESEQRPQPPHDEPCEPHQVLPTNSSHDCRTPHPPS